MIEIIDLVGVLRLCDAEKEGRKNMTIPLGHQLLKQPSKRWQRLTIVVGSKPRHFPDLVTLLALSLMCLGAPVLREVVFV